MFSCFYNALKAECFIFQILCKGVDFYLLDNFPNVAVDLPLLLMKLSSRTKSLNKFRLTISSTIKSHAAWEQQVSIGKDRI